MAHFKNAEHYHPTEQPLLDPSHLCLKLTELIDGVNQRISELGLTPKQSFYTRCSLWFLLALCVIMFLYNLLSICTRRFGRKSIPAKSKHQ